MEKDYLNVNRAAWNARTPVHLASAFYDQASFLEGKSSLNELELELLGDVQGKSLLHLQCHFGQDSLSLARMGAVVTGVDLADEAIRTARQLNRELDLDARFLCCDVFDLPDHLEGQFDVIFTSYGVLSWLPELRSWARVIRHFLKPGGKVVVVEFHPVLWMFDDDNEQRIYPYSSPEPITVETETSYADSQVPLRCQEINWNHGLAEVLGNLLREGLVIRDFQEYFYSPYPCFSGMERIGEKRYVISKFGDKVPYVFSLVAERH